MNFILLTFCSTILASSLLQLQHAKIYKDQNISGWMMSEKLDGIRGYWDGKEMYTKQGNILFAPNKFTNNFPPFALDGELWSQRQDFENIQSTVLKHHSSWVNITYNIFEVPRAKGDFIKRLQKARNWFQKHQNSHVHIIKQHPCPNQKVLLKYLENVTAKGGEGVMVKDPALTYFMGRTAHILKVKKAQDMEGKVTAHHYRTDRHTLKSLTIQLKNSVSFKLGNGFTNEQRQNPPVIGSTITFKYYGFTKNGKPKFASYMRIQKVF